MAQYYDNCLLATRGSNYIMQQAPYGDNNYPQYPYPGVSSNMVVPLSIAATPPIDPALATAGGPMPVMPQPAIHSPYGQGPLTPDSDSATLVVGSQSRGAILPRVPGKPAVPAAGLAEVLQRTTCHSERFRNSIPRCSQ